MSATMNRGAALGDPACPYRLATPAEVLEDKLRIWNTRLSFALASSDDENWIEECERAVRDLAAKLSEASA